MARFRTKNIEIEAVRYGIAHEPSEELKEFLKDNEWSLVKDGITFKTRGGSDVIAYNTDWIIRDREGWFYCLSTGVFEAIYEAV